MEDLTKQQIILLALLVSFVSSIATGIVTVSLMQQNEPVTVTQTINRIVEKTIETVIPEDAQKSQKSNTQITNVGGTIKETVIIREDQAVVDAITKANKSIVRLYVSYSGVASVFASNDIGNFIGLGVIADSSGKIIAKIDNPYNVIAGGVINARLDGGNIVPVAYISNDSTTGLSILQAEQSSDPKNSRVYVSAEFGDSKSISVGQAAILISGNISTSVATGIVSSIDRVGGPYPTTNPAQTIHTSIKDATFMSQAVLVNMSGEIIGIKDGSKDSSFASSDIIKGL